MNIFGYSFVQKNYICPTLYWNKPAAKAAGADPFQCNSTDRQNQPKAFLQHFFGLVKILCLSASLLESPNFCGLLCWKKVASYVWNNSGWIFLHKWLKKEKLHSRSCFWPQPPPARQVFLSQQPNLQHLSCWEKPQKDRQKRQSFGRWNPFD